MTFSIVAADPETGDVGVAVASKFLAVGAIVPWARAEVGAVATQSFADVTLGPRGLALLAEGLPPDQALDRLLVDDAERETRQVGIVSADGRAASFSGANCMDWAGGRMGSGYAAQGNILAGEQVVAAMADTFESTAEQPLADRLLAAIRAGDAQGGDRRGRQSAALLVARPNGGYGGNHDRYLDLRIDDHPQPVEEVGRLMDLHHLYFDRPNPASLLPLTDDIRSEMEAVLQHTGRGGEPATFGDRFYELIATENLEERWVSADQIDPQALAFIRRLATKP